MFRRRAQKLVLSSVMLLLANSLSGCGLLEIFGRALGAVCDVEAYVVTKTEDTNDGICTTDDCSLREAVITANACGGAHIIELPAGTYGLSIAGTGEDESATGDLDIIADITLTGDSSIVDGNGLDAVISIMEGADAALVDLIVQGGSDTGIQVYGHVRMDGVTVRNNVGIAGGGVYVHNGAEATLETVVVRNNQGTAGGGVYVTGRGQAILLNVTLEDNRAVPVEGIPVGGYGGGIFIESVGQARISESAIRNNSANANGGGVWSQGGSYTSIIDTMITDNVADGDAGGLMFGGRAEMVGSQVVGNRAGGSGGGIGIYPSHSVGTPTPDYFPPVDITDTTIRANFGGGIYNGGILTLENVTVSDNTPNTADQPGITNEATLNMLASQVTGNTGGGLTNFGSMIVQDSTIDANTGATFGGIATAGDGLVERSTISGNESSTFGGGILLLSGAELELVNSTVSGNMAGTGGGGIIVTPAGADPFGTVAIKDSTITGNRPNGLVDSFGGVTLLRTVVAYNTPADCVGEGIDSLGYNLDLDGSCALGASGDLPTVDPRLGPLADNGGETFTHALLPSSPAIDAAGASCATTDQRGVSRPDGPACDIGAFEMSAAFAVGTPDPFSSAAPIAQPMGPVTCRSGPSTVFPPEAYFEGGQELRVLNRDGNASWLEVQGDGKPPCWVNKDLLDIDPAFNLLDLPLGVIPPTPTWTPPPPTDTPGQAVGCLITNQQQQQVCVPRACTQNDFPGTACTP